MIKMASFIDIHNMNMKKKSSNGTSSTRSGNNKRRKRSESSVKVVYISSPMKVKTSASRFRSLVQELTGRDSDVSQYFSELGNVDDYNDELFATTSTTNNTPYSVEEVVPTSRVSSTSTDSLLAHSLVDIDCNHHRDSPTSSESLLDDVFSSDMVEMLEGMFASSLFYDHEFSFDQLVNVP